MNRDALICRSLDRPLAQRCPRTRAGHDMTTIPDVPVWDAASFSLDDVAVGDELAVDDALRRP